MGCGIGDRIMILSPGGGGYGDPTDGIVVNGSSIVNNNMSLSRTTGSVNQYTMDQETV